MKPKLSKRAEKLLKRVRDDTKFYPALEDKEPDAMKELEAAGLVTMQGRITRMTLCWVPVGTKPFVIERYPR